MVGGAFGFLWFGWAKYISRRKLLIKWYMLPVFLVLSVVLGGWAAH
jgi:hypothetical protein